MGWEFRLATKDVDYGPFGGVVKEYGIVEVLYEEDGFIKGVTDFEELNGWSSIDGLKDTLEKVLGAFDKPLFCHYDLNGEIDYYKYD